MIQKKEKQQWCTVTPSTLITLLRMVLVPFIGIFMVREHWGVAYGLFLFAAATDVLDGALARYLHQETKLGAYLDPLADKLLVVSCYAGLAFVHTPLFKIPLWFFAVMLVKELCLIAGAVYLGLIKKIIVIKPAILGKITTFAQVVFVWWLFTSAYFGYVSQPIFNIFIFVLTLLMVVTFGYYVFKAYASYTLAAYSKKYKG
ncbi:CDP-alcohol phosphatidyltransferase family protein [Candidatus Dependentiae bacterium]|nr:CDP-alcohol phosphatidyltransferase family protein [Candidatus Dependentiae bacterium]